MESNRSRSHHRRIHRSDTMSQYQQHHERQQLISTFGCVRNVFQLLFLFCYTIFSSTTSRTTTTTTNAYTTVSKIRKSYSCCHYSDSTPRIFSQLDRYMSTADITEERVVLNHHDPYLSQEPDDDMKNIHSKNNNNNHNNNNRIRLVGTSQLLDRALVLRRRVVHHTTITTISMSRTTTTTFPTTATTTWQWLLQQLDESMIPYLIQQFRMLSATSTTTTSSSSLFGWSTKSENVLQQQLDHYEQLFQEMTLMNHNNDTLLEVNNVTTTPSSISTVSVFDNVDDDDDTTDVESAVMTTNQVDTEHIDVIIIGSGLSGLCAGAILNTVYHKKVAIFESHSLPGGCAHAFTRTITTTSTTTKPNTNTSDGNNDQKEKVTFTFDSGPSILLGCSTTTSIPNALQQVLQLVQQNVTWIPYSGWNMIERSKNDTATENHTTNEWTVSLGPTDFIDGPLSEYGGDDAVVEFDALRNLTQSLTMGASIPAMSMRSGPASIVPLIVRHCSTLLALIQQGETVTGTFAPYMDGPIYTVKSTWLRNWLDALAFSLSGLPASRTAAAAMAFVLQDMHRSNAALDYPKGGMGEIVNALVRAVEQGPNGSRVYMSQHVESIDGNADATKIVGVTLRKNSQKILARNGVICNAPVWSLRKLIPDERIRTKLNMGIPLLQMQPKPPVSWTTTNKGSSINYSRDTQTEPSSSSSSSSSSTTTSLVKSGLISKCETIEMTASFIHLHIALNATGLNLHSLAAHYTVMDRSLSGDPSIVVNGVVDGPCSMCNMIAVSNPCVLDPTLAPEGYIVIHAYGAGNEPYEIWEGLQRNTPEYIQLKEERAQPLWRAIECIIPDVRDRVVVQMIGTPLTHERFLRRPRGTYGSVTEDYLRDGSTPYPNFVLASDSIFPGIGVPAVAIVGASAANSMVGVFEHLITLNRLEREGKLF